MLHIYCSTFGSSAKDGIYKVQIEKMQVKCAPLIMMKRIEYMVCSKKGVIFVAGQNGHGGSYIKSFLVQRENGYLKLLASRNFNWLGISHMALEEEKNIILIAVYGEGRVISIMAKDGRIGDELSNVVFEGKGMVKNRQESSHPHYVNSGRMGYMVADLGSDAIFYSDSNDLPEVSDLWGKIQERPGSGPRYICMHPLKNIFYLLTELSNELVVYERDSDFYYVKRRIQLTGNEKMECLASVIQIDKDAKKLFVGLRGKNQIIVFSLDQFGNPHREKTYRTSGWPRNFIYLEELDSLLLVNEDNKDSKGAIEIIDLSIDNSSRVLLKNAYQICEYNGVNENE